jgi:hypothetical protein
MRRAHKADFFAGGPICDLGNRQGVLVRSLDLKTTQSGNKTIASRPVTTYDSGYEYSVEHLLELQRMIEKAEEEDPAARYKAG